MAGLTSRGDRAEAVRAMTYDRLAWLYGHERAAKIVEGRDEATNADLAKWRNLGRRR